MSKKPAFWIVFVLVSLAGAVFAYRYFPQAFPILQLDISMDRRAALQAARELAEQHDLGPPNFRQAASFSADSRTQTRQIIRFKRTPPYRGSTVLTKTEVFLSNLRITTGFTGSPF